MKKTFFFSFFFLNFHSYAQLKSIQRDSIFRIEEIAPEYIGGIPEMFKFLGKNLKYPKSPRGKGIEGIIYVSFVVNETGELENIEVKKSKLTQRSYDNNLKKWLYSPVDRNELLEKESIRVVSLMPKWRPGIQHGKPKKVSYTLPIDYKID